MELGEPDAERAASPDTGSGSEYTMPVDSIVSAIGLATDLDFFEKEPETNRPAISKWGTFDVDPDHLMRPPFRASLPAATWSPARPPW